MSTKIYFMNNGMFDIRGMLTFGLSAKDKDDAIGFFGTGFKYAVGIILRHHGIVKITTRLPGDDRFYLYEFFSKKEKFRDQDADMVYLHDHTTGDVIPANFTTRIGINWEPWMAFRELYCNCIDEGGTISDQYQAGFDTVIEVECSQITDTYHNKDNYILPKMDPVYSCRDADVYERKLPYVFYRGIAVYRAENMNFTYNIKSYVKLTEDRTVESEYYVRFALQKTIQGCDVERVIASIVQNNDCYEAKVGFDKGYHTSNTFIDVCQRLRKTDKGICETARSLINQLAYDKRNFPEFDLTKVQKIMLDRAKSFLLKMDIPVDQYPIKFVNGLGEGVMGRALDGTIYISEMPFNMGTKQLASTLMEEWVHLKTGCKDFDRTMQNWLFDKILSLGENINGEPV